MERGSGSGMICIQTYKQLKIRTDFTYIDIVLEWISDNIFDSLLGSSRGGISKVEKTMMEIYPQRNTVSLEPMSVHVHNPGGISDTKPK